MFPSKLLLELIIYCTGSLLSFAWYVAYAGKCSVKRGQHPYLEKKAQIIIWIAKRNSFVVELISFENGLVINSNKCLLLGIQIKEIS